MKPSSPLLCITCYQDSCILAMETLKADFRQLHNASQPSALIPSRCLLALTVRRRARKRASLPSTTFLVNRSSMHGSVAVLCMVVSSLPLEKLIETLKAMVLEQSRYGRRKMLKHCRERGNVHVGGKCHGRREKCH